MKRVTYLPLIVIGLAAAAPARAQELVAFKSPGGGMHFTEGLPIVVFLDLLDGGSGFGTIETDANGTVIGWPQGQLFIDGVQWPDNQSGLLTIPGSTMTDTNGNPSPVDFYRMEAATVPAGSHQMVAHGLFQNGDNQASTPIGITVDPWPSDKQQVNLSGDVTMSNLNWSNVAVRGDGGTLTLTGNVTIKNSLIVGFGQITSNGTVGTVDIEGSIFEDTGQLALMLAGAATITDNEFRANNRLTFVSNDPSVPTIISLQGSGDGSTTNVFQGNRVGAGRLDFLNTSNWLIGGDTDDESNILIGPRCTFNIVNSSQITLRGNYSRHAYRGGWSQGYNFFYYGSTTGILAEHNLIRGGSWPVQDVTGEFRYNVVYGYGHNWIRTAETGAAVHHNLFAPESAGDLGDGLFFYVGETNLQIYNNTFDGGGDAAGDFAGPMVGLFGNTQVASLRNNLFTNARDMLNDNPGYPAVAFADNATYAYADYNAFYSPDNATKDNYAITIAGLTEGSPGFGGGDVSGTGAVGVIDGQLASTPYAGTRILPYSTVVDEAAVWQKTQRLSTILAAFRTTYTPKAGSPIINAGDPQDDDSQGRRADVGAIDRDGHDQDKLGKFGAVPVETVPPTVSLTAPTANSTVSGIIDLAAMAQDNPGGSGVVLVQFLVDGNTVGQTAASPYAVSFNTGSLTNGNHAFAAKAWDAAGNSAISAAVNANVVVVTNPDGGISAPDARRPDGGSSSGGGPGSGSSKVTGGCACAVSPDGASRGWWAALVVLCAPIAVRKRRRRPRGRLPGSFT